LEGVGDRFFRDCEAIDASREAGPLGAFESEEEFVNVVMAILAAGEGGFDFLADGERAEYIADGLVEKGVGDGQQAHEEECRAFVVHMGGVRKGLAEIGAGKRGADEFGRLAAGKSNDGKDGDPASEFTFTEKHESVADAVDFGAQAEERGVQIAEKAIEKRRLVLQEFFDCGIVEFGSGNEIQEAELKQLVARDLASFEHGRLTEEIALEIGIAEAAGLGEFVFGFNFLGEKGDAGVGVFVDDATATVGVEQLEINLEVFGAFNERREFGMVDKVVEREGIAGVGETAADSYNFIGRSDGF